MIFIRQLTPRCLSGAHLAAAAQQRRRLQQHATIDALPLMPVVAMQRF
jgi:hypothetical protein